MKMRTKVAALSHTGAIHPKLTMATTLLLDASALVTTADEFVKKLRDANMHWKFRSPTPLDSQSLGLPINFGYIPLATEKVIEVPPLADIEFPEFALTDAHEERPFREGNKSSVFKKNRESFADRNETLISTAPSGIAPLVSTNTSMDAMEFVDDWIEIELRGKV